MVVLEATHDYHSRPESLDGQCARGGGKLDHVGGSTLDLWLSTSRENVRWLFAHRHSPSARSLPA